MRYHALFLSIAVILCSSCVPRLDPIQAKKLYFYGNGNVVFQYSGVYSNDDSVCGEIQFDITAGIDSGTKRYVINGDISKTVQYKFTDLNKIVSLPEFELKKYFTDKDIEKIVISRSMTDEQIMNMGISGSMMIVRYDLDYAKSIGVKIAEGNYIQFKHHPFESSLGSEQLQYADEAVLVWLKILLPSINMIQELLGSWELESITQMEYDRFEVVMRNNNENVIVTTLMKNDIGPVKITIVKGDQLWKLERM